MPATLSPRSLKCLTGVHPDLARVAHRAAELGPDFVLTEGLRSKARQAQLVKARKSKTMNSRHLTGHAVDFVARLDDGAVSYETEHMRPVADAFKAAADELGVKITRGIDWGWDSPHIELDRKAYPAGAPLPQPVLEAPALALSVDVKPLYKSRKLHNTMWGGSILVYLHEWITWGLNAVTAAATQFAAMGPSRDLLAMIGGNGKAVGIAIGVGCLFSAIAAGVDDHNKASKNDPPSA